MKQTNIKGFTLVELAIVLVIIGLLVGGVLQGQELIKQAQVRSAIGRVSEFDTALNTFRAKYRELPGDITKANAFGLNRPRGSTASATSHNTSDTGTTNDDGNGDGLLQATNTAGSLAYANYGGEYANFWVHLSNASLIKGNYTCGTGASIAMCPSATASAVLAGSHYPEISIGNGILIVTDGGKLTYMMGLNSNFSATAAMTTATLSTTTAMNSTLTPEEAYGIDSKIDDGKPTSGGTQTVASFGGESGTTSTTGSKFVSVTASTTVCNSSTDYNVGLDAKLCSLRVRASS
jgi:prepilin-type N-terminal cleavage/methylation domain-containing protein